VDSAFADLLGVEHGLLDALPEGGRTALAGLLRDLVAPFDAS
jgi:hypothetical protein